MHELIICADPNDAAHRAASSIAQLLNDAVVARGQASLAVSGGTTAAALLDALVEAPVPWRDVQIIQVDERVAPDGDPDRNLTTLTEHLTVPAHIPPGNVHAMPVTQLAPGAAARAYAATLQRLGEVIDVVHLGLGDDGHTASLVPGDPVLQVARVAVATTGMYKGRRRLTLTYPAIDRSRSIVWLATGAAKADVVPRLLAGDVSIPAGRVRPVGSSTVFVDAAAAANVR
jgi:6-phosphogluconolactonase